MKDEDSVITSGPTGSPETGKPTPAADHPGSPGVQINESDIDDPGDPDSPTTENDVT